MKSFALVAVLFAVTMSGCTSIGIAYMESRRNILNNRHEGRYQKAVADHAGDGELVGTWTIDVPEDETIRKKLNPPPPTHTHTVSLYGDQTYSYLRTERKYGMHKRTTRGHWAKEEPGLIALTPSASDTEGMWFDKIKLEEWTNLFVESDKALHRPD